MALKIVESTMRGLQGEPIQEVQYESRKQTIAVLSLGATIKSWHVLNQDKQLMPVVLSYQNDKDYLTNVKMLGATVGPYAGRLYPTDFDLAGTKVSLEQNFNNHANLHSGKDNLALKHFEVQLLDDETAQFTKTLPKDTHNFLGTMNFTITMRFLQNGLDITYETTSDETTLANLTNHTYFNLNGDANETVLNHHLKMPAQQVAALDDNNIPQSLSFTKATPFDYTQAKLLRSGVKALKDTPQQGLDHPFVLTGEPIHLYSPKTNLSLSVQTDYDAVVVYTNNVTAPVNFKPNVPDRPHLGICLECQHMPNDVHTAQAPKSLLLKDTTKTRHIQYRFSTG